MKPLSFFVLGLALATFPGSSRAASPEVSRPYAHKNLTIYFLEGADTVPEDYVPLDEALERKQARVIETGDVGRLIVVNRSNKPLFVHAGDIVKGGQQDRTVAQDTLVPPRQRRALKVFCVEQERWHRRGREPVTEFASAKNMLSSREQKLAAKLAKRQGDVWAEVEAGQDKLGRSLNKNVKQAASASSLQLTLEEGDVDAAAKDFVAKLGGMLEAHPQAVGYAFAINGEVSAAEVYGSNRLFRRLWPRLLASNAVEAVMELRAHKGQAPPQAAEVLAFVQTVEAQRPQVELDDATQRAERHETAESVLFSTRDKRRAEAVVHKSYLKKSIVKPQKPTAVPTLRRHPLP